jgi:hypothetical protein
MMGLHKASQIDPPRPVIAADSYKVGGFPFCEGISLALIKVLFQEN